MDFSDALKALREGKKVRRDCYYKNCYLIVENNHVTRKTTEGECYTYFYKVDDEDLLAGDWEIIEEPQKVPVKTKTIEYITCSKCGKDIEVEPTNKIVMCKFCKNEMVLERDNELTVEEAKCILDLANFFNIMYFPMLTRCK